MKKFCLILSVVAGFIACSNEGLQEMTVQKSTPLPQRYDPNRRSFAEAVEIAQNSINMLEEDRAETRGIAPVRKLNLKDGIKAYCKAGTRSGEVGSTNDTLLYVFNFEDNQGFSVVSASRHTEGLVAVVEEGNYDPSVPTGNPGFDTYMNMAKAYIAYEDKKGMESEQAITRSETENMIVKPVYDTIDYKKVLPRVTVKWGQDLTMGQFCPNWIAGCGPTAAAQIMSFFQYPSVHALTFSERDVNYTTFSWSNMCARTYADKANNWDEYDKQIGRLVRQIGKESGATYHTDGSGTSTTIANVRNTMVSWGYNAGNISDYSCNTADETYVVGYILGSGKLIYMRGTNSDDEGHAWVIDGCKYVKCLHRLMVSYDGGSSWSVFQEVCTYRTCLNHINWGWKGKGNGYFYSCVLNAYYPTVNEDNSNKYHLEDGLNRNFYKNVRYFSVWH